MAQPFLAQIQCFAFNFAPKNWALCNGQILPLQQNTALFSLLGTYYGGNGTSTFALPNLQSRVPMHWGTSPSGPSYVIGQQAGEEQVRLLLGNLPQHNHGFVGSTANGSQSNADPGFLMATANIGSGTPTSIYGPVSGATPLNPAVMSLVGQTQPHENRQPYLTLNWCIATSGIYPSRN